MRAFLRSPSRYAAGLVSLALVLLALGAVWWPIVAHYRVTSPSLGESDLEILRASPSNDVLEGIVTPFFFGGGYSETDGTTDLADRLIGGELRIRPGGILQVDPYFRPEDLTEGPTGWRLDHASLVIPWIFLRSYEASGRDLYLDAARRFILAFAEFDRRAILPTGLHWNDHAVAARIVVLADFWRHYRRHPSFDLKEATSIMQFVARSLKLLGNDRHYTFATNHGVMQSLAILHGCVAFPTAVCGGKDRDRAIARLKEQFEYYVNDEGVVLEHSAEYHRFGVILLGHTFKYLSLLGMEIPEDWLTKYRRAQSVYAALRRPDGSLPRLGDSYGWPDPDGPAVVQIGPDGRAGPLGSVSDWSPADAQTFLPAAGHAVWWDGLARWPGPDNLAQTIVTWSYYPGHGHKHADETGIFVWANGERWWTATGNTAFPPNKAYRGPWGHSAAWEASNAAHVIGEDVVADRSTTVLGYGWSRAVAAIDLERREGSGFRARRQLVRVPPSIWIVIDSFTDARVRRTRTIWMSDRDKAHAEDSLSGLWTVASLGSGKRMKVAIFGSPEPAVRSVWGSVDPYAGWVTAGRLVQAPAFIVEQESNDAWSGLVASVESRDQPLLTARPDMRRWQNPARWTLLVPTVQGPIEVRRDGDRLSVVAPPTDGLGAPRRADLTLAPAPDVSSRVQAVRAAFSAASEKYGKPFRDLVPYRWKVTYALLGLFILQELFLALWRRMVKRWAPALRLATLPLWAAMIVWAIPTYLAT